MTESQTAPVVLVHGIFGFSQLTLGGLKIADYFRDIPDALRSGGHVVPTPPQLNPAGSVAERAQDLKRYLQDQSDVVGKRVHVIAHSLGGLDARFLISKLDMADRILSLTTIGAPHHGTPIADVVRENTDPALNEFMEHLGIDLKAVSDLTTQACRRFNIDVPDAPHVRYFSIAGQFEPPRNPLTRRPHGLLGRTHDIVREREQNNDGLVSVQSATFAERAETWVSLDVWEASHFRLINWGNNIVPSPFDFADTTIVERYRSLVAHVKQLVG